MSESPPARWRAWAAGAMFLALAVGGLLIVQPDAAPVPAPAPVAKAPAPPAPARPIVPRPPPPLDRAALIAATDAAASRYAAGLPPAVALLAGRRFAVNLPFGCAGPVEDLDTVASGWSYDAETGTLRAQVQPQRWAKGPFLTAIAPGVEFEAAEGFWIERPWSSSEVCPPAPATAEEPDPRQTLALIELFEDGARRAEQRGDRAYRTVEQVEPGTFALDQGLRLRVEGRLVAFGDGPPIGCWSSSPRLRPVCAVRARFDRIAITDALGEVTLAEWKS